MNMRFYPLLLVPLFALTACDQMKASLSPGKTEPAADTQAVASTDSSPVVATVNGTPITQNILEVYTGQRSAKGAGKAKPEEMINELVTLELMRQEADHEGLNAEPIVVASINQLERSALAGAAIKMFMKNNPVTDAEVKDYYDQKIATPTKEYKARHILLKSEEEARKVIAMLDSGKDFAELAKKMSTGPSGPSGGELGWFSPTQMVKEFADAAAALKKGQYTKTPVHTQFGWHVIELEDVRDSTPPSFDEVKDRIKLGLANQKLQKHIMELREKASIDIKGQPETSDSEPQSTPDSESESKPESAPENN
jgi:peptidyl-prolyl cis-trans isomerase C